MSFPVVLMRAANFRGDATQQDVVVCSSGAIAKLWRDAYIKNGWLVCWVGGWEPIQSEPPTAIAHTFPMHTATNLPVTPEEDEAFNAMSKRDSGCLSLTIGPQRYT